MRKVSISLYTLVVLLSGCLGTADPVIIIKGQIADKNNQSYDVCMISVMSTNTDKLHDRAVAYKHQEVLAAFPVHQTNKRLHVVIECEGAKSKYKSEDFPSVGEIHDIGRIVLERE